MDQLPVPVKFVLAFAVVIVLIMVTASIIRWFSESSRPRPALGVQPMAVSRELPWRIVWLSVAMTHFAVFATASRPQFGVAFKVVVLVFAVVALMSILRRAFARS